MPCDSAAVFVIGVLLTQAVCPLKLHRVGVPQFKLRGEAAMLECLFELEDDALYSVKWYKDDEEFYRYVPKSRPPNTSYKLEGIKVDMQQSDAQKVVLHSVNIKSSGVYRCEVSAEAPSFASVQREGRMDVVVLPKDGPSISGEKRVYQVGDLIDLNCTSGKSFPASALHWYINEREVRDRSLLSGPERLVHAHGLVSSRLGLRLVVRPEHFLRGELRLRCVARLLLWEGDRESVVHRDVFGADEVREALFFVRGSSSRHEASLVLLATAAFLMLTGT